MRNDTNGGSNLQWFFFRVRNPENMTDMIRINIVNFTKGNSLFYYGMKPSIWSLNANKKNQVGWIQGGQNVDYDISPYHEEINKMNPHKPKSYYCMSFDYKFETGNDDVYFSYTVPYSYSQLLSHLRQVKELAESQNSKLVTFSSIGKSNGGFDIPLIKITSPDSDGNVRINKPTVLIIGR